MAAGIGFELPFGVKPVNPTPVDTWSGPYYGATITDARNVALSSIDSSRRFPTMEVRLIAGNQGYKYWFRNGIADIDLVEFIGGAGSTGATGASGIQGNPGATGASGLQGPQGATGATGIQGATGASGIQGFQGSTGASGLQGLQGSTGASGIQGLQGSTGASGIQGLQGSTGASGIQGLQGSTGASGLQGLQGATGASGIQGLQGATGASGIQGLQGATGASGIQGNIGSTGATGPEGPAGTSVTIEGSLALTPGNEQAELNDTGNSWYPPVQGYGVIDTNTGNLWVYDGTTWNNVGQVRGPAGATGATGSGATGASGLQGNPGATGASGIQGLQGATGASGLIGFQGATGASGLQGLQGSTGASGPIGATGAISPIDSQLSLTSTNAIMNSAVTAGFQLLVPAPTYTAPIATLTNFSTTNYEIGANVTQTLTVNWTQNDAGTKGIHTLYKNGSSVLQGVSVPATYNVNEAAALNTTTYQLSVNYGTGPIKNNILNFPDSRGQILAGSVTTSRSYTGYYRRWIGSHSAFLSNPNQVRTLSLTTSLDFNTTLATQQSPVYINNKFIYIVVPNTRVLTTVITEANENLTSQFNLSSVQIQDAGGTDRAYKLYYLETALPLNADLTNVTIANA